MTTPRLDILASHAPPMRVKDRPLDLIAEVAWSDVEAADGESKLKKFSMVAYTGGTLQLMYWPYPVVIDLAGLKVAGRSRPVLKDHQSSLIVGHTTAIKKSGDTLTAEGLISGAGAVAREVVQSAANGFPWQVSVGARSERIVFVAEGKSAKANGRTFEGPVYIARKATLGEISMVAMGADDRTSARVAASAAHLEDGHMKFADWLKAKGFDPDELSEEQEKSLKAVYDAEVKAQATPADPPVDPPADPPGDGAGGEPDDPAAQLRAAAAVESKRIAVVTAAAKGHPEIEAKAIEEGWTGERTELEVLRASRPQAPAIHAPEADAFAPSVIEAALCTAGSLPGVEKQFEDKVLQAAHTRFHGRIGLQELLLEAALQSGYTGRTFRTGDLQPILQAAFSTISLPGILGATANKFLLAGFESVESTWRSVASRRNVKDFKTLTNYRLSGGFDYDEVGPDGELKHATVSEDSYTNQAKTYGKMYSITRTDIINDDLGALTVIPRRIGRGGALKLNTVFWTAFLNDATFFKTANINYASGAGTALSSAALTAALLGFRKQTDPDGKPLALTPRILLVPPELEITADELMTSTQVNTGGAATSTKVPNRNVWASKFQVAMASHLSNSAISGYSLTAWYLLADPSDLSTVEVVFLNGVETPTVESADADFNVLGIQMRGYHDFGVTLQEYRAGYKMAGA